jgi:hypothetical protein
VHEVGVEGDGAIALGPVGPLQREAQQLLQTLGVSLAARMRDDRHRQHAAVGGQDLACPVGRPVVAREDVVFPREGGEHLPHLPEHEPRGARFVVNRDADVDHGPAI